MRLYCLTILTTESPIKIQVQNRKLFPKMLQKLYANCKYTWISSILTFIVDGVA